MTVTLTLALGFLLSVGLAVTAQAGELPPREKLPAVQELPNPFTFLDGTPIQTKKDWQRRRDEIKQMVQHYAYGFVPPAGGTVQAEDMGAGQNNTRGATEKKLLLHMGPGGKVQTHLYLTVPDGKRKCPVIVVGDVCWGRVDAAIVAEVVKRGYILAEFDRTEVAPDKDGRSEGLYAVYPNADFGALAAWAWGYQRVLDYLLTLPNVDAKHIAITGHSRGGKATLLAGALDDRVALVAPNAAGCMGTGCTRFVYTGETLPIIQSHFPYWFSPRLAEFAGHEEQLPFDQHLLKALVAPRALLTTEGLADDWANQKGGQATNQAAKVVYDYLGASDRIGAAYREGGHAHNLADWTSLLNFADQQFFGKHKDLRFDALQYPDDSARVFHWAAPQGKG